MSNGNPFGMPFVDITKILEQFKLPGIDITLLVRECEQG